MALAAALSADGSRPASFLPSVKCSQCSDMIEISKMGDHVCGKSDASQPTSGYISSSNPFTLRQYDPTGSRPAQPSPLQFSSNTPQTRVRAPTLSSKLPRMAPPPRINPDVANMPFLRPESPMSPAVSTRSGASSNGGRPPAIRSQTSPLPRLWDRPPSPELSANLDCAFPPFPPPNSSGGRPGTSNGRKTPSSDQSSSRTGSRQDGRWPIERDGNESTLERVHTLPGGTLPFHLEASIVADPRRPSRIDGQSVTSASAAPSDRRRRPSEPAYAPWDPSDISSRPSTATSNYSQTSRPLTEKQIVSGNAINDRNFSPPARPERSEDEVLLSPRFLSQFSSEPLSTLSDPFPISTPQSDGRSQTFPLQGEQGLWADDTRPPISKSPSEPVVRPQQQPKFVHSARSEPVQLQPLHTELPSRGPSMDATRMDYRMQDAPPVPRPIQQLNRQNSNHRSSGSGSSTGSSTSSTGHSNYSHGDGPSPVESAASSVDVSPLASDVFGEEPQRPRTLGLSRTRTNGKAQEPGLRAELPRQPKSPPRDFSRPMPIVSSHTTVAQTVSPLRDDKEPTNDGPSWPLESPMDPAMQGQRRGKGEQAQADSQPPFDACPPMMGPLVHSELVQDRPPVQTSGLSPSKGLRSPSRPPPPQQSYSAYRPAPSPYPPQSEAGPPSRSITPGLPQSTSRSQTPQTVNSQFKPPTSTLPQPPPVPQSQPRPSLSRRPTTSGNRAPCRGCGLPIEGKSVKAADGRLTGRWHKACFVCRACAQPFTTADFYVHDNHPFCEQHYHEQNGSLCHGCHRGIEGPYLETTSSTMPAAAAHGVRKYHPRCFTCVDCRQVLSEDYFEIAGRVFCERHALAAMRAQARKAGGGPGPGANGRGPSAIGAGPGLMPYGRSGLTAERRTTRLMIM